MERAAPPVFFAHAGDDRIIAEIDRLNRNPEVTGILLNLPLPPGVDTPALRHAIDPYKDAEGVNPANIGFSAAIASTTNKPVMMPAC